MINAVGALEVVEDGLSGDEYCEGKVVHVANNLYYTFLRIKI